MSTSILKGFKINDHRFYLSGDGFLKYDSKQNCKATFWQKINPFSSHSIYHIFGAVSKELESTLENILSEPNKSIYQKVVSTQNFKKSYEDLLIIATVANKIIDERSQRIYEIEVFSERFRRKRPFLTKILLCNQIVKIVFSTIKQIFFEIRSHGWNANLRVDLTLKGAVLYILFKSKFANSYFWPFQNELSKIDRECAYYPELAKKIGQMRLRDETVSILASPLEKGLLIRLFKTKNQQLVGSLTFHKDRLFQYKFVMIKLHSKIDNVYFSYHKEILQNIYQLCVEIHEHE